MKFTLVLFDLNPADNNSSITQLSHQNFFFFFFTVIPCILFNGSTPKMDFKVIHYVKKNGR
jgi:hypothetical protein